MAKSLEELRDKIAIRKQKVIAYAKFVESVLWRKGNVIGQEKKKLYTIYTLEMKNLRGFDLVGIFNLDEFGSNTIKLFYQDHNASAKELVFEAAWRGNIDNCHVHVFKESLRRYALSQNASWQTSLEDVIIDGDKLARARSTSLAEANELAAIKMTYGRDSIIAEARRLGL